MREVSIRKVLSSAMKAGAEGGGSGSLRSSDIKHPRGIIFVIRIRLRIMVQLFPQHERTREILFVTGISLLPLLKLSGLRC